MPLPRAKSNSFVSNSFFIFIIRFFPSLANLLVMIWYSHHLPQAAYGNYQHFWIQLNVIFPLACFGIHVLLISYPPDTVMRLLRRIGGAQYLVYAAWVLGLSGVFAFLQSSAIGITFVIPFLYLVFFSLSVILESILIVHRNYALLTITSVVYSAAFWLIHFFVLEQGFSLQTLFTYLLTITALRMCIYSIVVIGKLKNAVGGNDDIDIVRTKHLWMQLGLYDIVQVLFNYIDKFIISIVCAAQLSAVYYNGSQTIPFLPLLISAAGSTVLILLANEDKENETANIIHLMNRVGKFLSCIAFPVFFFLLFFRNELIIRLLGDKYEASIPIFLASILVLPVRAYSFTTVLQRLHKGAVINVGAIADLLFACMLMYPLYKWLGLPGVALSFVISTYLQLGFYLFYAARLLKVSPLKLVPYKNWLIKFIVFSILFISIRYVGNTYFHGKIDLNLILGGSVMTIMVISSLAIEFINQRNDVNIGS
jgi:O-antigen/teichoic acid export membrane protein